MHTRHGLLPRPPRTTPAHTRTHARTHACTHTYTHVCMHTHTHMHARTHTHTRTLTHTHTHTRTQVDKCSHSEALRAALHSLAAPAAAPPAAQPAGVGGGLPGSQSAGIGGGGAGGAGAQKGVGPPAGGAGTNSGSGSGRSSAPRQEDEAVCEAVLGALVCVPHAAPQLAQLAWKVGVRVRRASVCVCVCVRICICACMRVCTCVRVHTSEVGQGVLGAEWGTSYFMAGWRGPRGWGGVIGFLRTRGGHTLLPACNTPGTTPDHRCPPAGLAASRGTRAAGPGASASQALHQGCLLRGAPWRSEWQWQSTVHTHTYAHTPLGMACEGERPHRMGRCMAPCVQALEGIDSLTPLASIPNKPEQVNNCHQVMLRSPFPAKWACTISCFLRTHTHTHIHTYTGRC